MSNVKANLVHEMVHETRSNRREEVADLVAVAWSGKDRQPPHVGCYEWQVAEAANVARPGRLTRTARSEILSATSPCQGMISYARWDGNLSSKRRCTGT